jgi:Na+/H+ antiporter NhaD/arsenite permease-like protein
MLLIRPLIRANAHRAHKAHTIVFFIFLVANIGRCLTPFGDPPLFLGFLKGVSFFWTTKHLLAPFLLVSSVLPAVYFLLDCFLFRREGRPAQSSCPHNAQAPKPALSGRQLSPSVDTRGRVSAPCRRVKNILISGNSIKKS